MSTVNVMPIGTCRIHTPLRHAVSKFPFKLDLTRNYGFVHTSAEVLQQLIVVTSGDPVSKELWPLIYRPSFSSEFLTRPLRPIDLFFFEISSVKCVTVNAVPVQLNYVTRHFNEFFSERTFAHRFWAMANDEHCADRLAWLKTLSRYDRLSREDKELLAALRMRQQTADEIAADMAAIVERVGAEKAVFVTHINALRPDNAPIASRAQLIKVVERVAASLNVRCFNPSRYMLAFGQENAMEQQGLDLTHFSRPFANQLGEIWFENYIKPAYNSAEVADLERIKVEQTEVDSLQAQFEAGNLVKVSRRLHSLVRSGKATERHRRLLAQVAFELGDFEKTTIVLKALRANSGAFEDDDILLMKALLEMDDNINALNLGRSLLSDEQAGEGILEACAVAAQNLGLLREALVYRRRLVTSGTLRQHAASLLSLLLQLHELDEVNKLADTILTKTPDDLVCLRAKWQAALMRRDTVALIGLAESMSALEDGAFLELVQTTWDAGLAKPSATLLGARLRRNPPSEVVAQLALQLEAGWRTEGMSALEAGDLQRAADLLMGCIDLLPGARTSKRTGLALERRLRSEVRQAFAAKDHARVVFLTKILHENCLECNGIEAVIARSAGELGQYEVALTYLSKALERDPSAGSRLQFARVAAKARQYAQALTAYIAVLNDCTATPAQRSIAQRAITGMHSGVVNAAREAIAADHIDVAWNLLKLLLAHSNKEKQIQQEQARLIRQLRLKLNSFDADESAKRLELANTILSLLPTDLKVRRIAALAAMRTLDFSQARDHWRILARQGELTPKIESAIIKCEFWMTRGRARKAA